MKALILAAGAGTRLKPLTDNIAKPALPICGVPSLWFGAWWLSRNLKISEFAINCSYKSETLIKAAKDRELVEFTGINFFISHEEDHILGSSGALFKIKNWINRESLAVINADAIQTPDWAKLLKCHQKSKGLLTLHLRKFNNSTEEYTTIDVDEYGRVIGFGKKAKSGVMFTGAYIIEPNAIDLLPAGISELMETLLKPLMQKRELFGYIDTQSNWLDTGTPQTYADANFSILKSQPEFIDLIKVKSDIHGSKLFVVPKGIMHHIKANINEPVVINSMSDCILEYLKDSTNSVGPNIIILENVSSAPLEKIVSAKILFQNNVTDIK